MEWSDLKEFLSSKKVWLKIPKSDLVFFISKNFFFIVEYENVGHIKDPSFEVYSFKIFKTNFVKKIFFF